MQARLGYVLIGMLACSPAYAAADSLAMENLRLELQAIETELQTLSIRMEGMAKDIHEMKQCNALARQPPINLPELRKLAKPKNADDEAKLMDMYKYDMVTRAECGLSLK